MRRRSRTLFGLTITITIAVAAFACGRERAPEAKTGATTPVDALPSPVISTTPDALVTSDAAPAPDATSAPFSPVVHLALQPLGATPRTCDFASDGAVRFGDTFDGVSDAKATPEAVSTLVAGLSSCGLCALAARPHQGVGKSKRRVVVELHAGAGIDCSADLPWELWTGEGKACAKVVEKALTPLQTQCTHCTWP